MEIWTDVSGVFSANPKIVKKASPIEFLSYKEAMELSFFGAKVIYFPTLRPLIENNIPSSGGTCNQSVVTQDESLLETCKILAKSESTDWSELLLCLCFVYVLEASLIVI